MFSFACRKFQALIHKRHDLPLSAREEAFIAHHRTVCSECGRIERQGALALSILREATMEGEVRSNFDDRVLRLWRIRSVHDSLRFWSPAMVGALIAGIIALATIQIVSSSHQIPSFNIRGHEAIRMGNETPVLPDLDPTNTTRHTR
jgi:hypothetical protein